MEDRFTILKNTFIDILQLKESNIATLHLLNSRIQKIKECYSDFISQNQDKISVFTLDSFHFQGRLIDIEYEDMNRIFLSITNRMYCDYYKLFKIIVEYVVENIPDKKILELIQINQNQYPVYKDLEPFKQYEIHYIQSLHELLLGILHYLNGFVIKKEYDLRQYQTKNKIGFNIDSFVHSFNYNNNVIKEKVSLFMTFIEFFHTLHLKYLKRFTTKLQLMLSQVNNDIKLENSVIERGNTKIALNDLKDCHIDKNILRELNENIGNEDFSMSTDTEDGKQNNMSFLSLSSDIEDMKQHNNSLDLSISSDTEDVKQNSIFLDLSDNQIIEQNIQGNLSEISEDNEILHLEKMMYSNTDVNYNKILKSPEDNPEINPEDIYNMHVLNRQYKDTIINTEEFAIEKPIELSDDDRISPLSANNT